MVPFGLHPLLVNLDHSSLDNSNLENSSLHFGISKKDQKYLFFWNTGEVQL